MKKTLPIFNYQKGQVVLIILLIMTVLLTIGLSLASRSVTDIKISQQTQEAARALWVAQAGLDKAIRANVGTGGNETLNEVNYNVVKTNFGEGTEFVYSQNVNADEIKTFWLIGHDGLGQIDENERYNGSSLTVYWGEGTNKPALEATYIYKGADNKFYSIRYAFDPEVRTPPTNFSVPGSGGSFGGKTFPASGNINVSGTPYILKLRLLFNSSAVPLGIKSQGDSYTFLSQGNCFDATATIVESNITKRLKECRFWQETPQIFNYLLFSGGSI